MVTGDLVARSLIVVRCFRIAVARLYVIIALLASRICSLQICVFWSSLHAVRYTLRTFC